MISSSEFYGLANGIIFKIRTIKVKKTTELSNNKTFKQTSQMDSTIRTQFLKHYQAHYINSHQHSQSACTSSSITGVN